MWSTPAGRLSLASQLLVLQLAVLASVLAVVGMISVQQSTRAFEEERGTQLRSVAEHLANLSVVRTQIRSEDASRSLAPAVSRALALSAAEEVSVASTQGVVLASSDPAENGKSAELGDSLVGEGRGWSGEVFQDGQRVLAAHAPILAGDGHLLGFAIAEADYPTALERLSRAAPDLPLYLGLGALLGVGGSLLLSRLTWRRTRGLRSAEIATLADHREALLFSIREGVVAVGTDGRVTVANDSARELVGLPGDVVGRRVTELHLGPDLEALLLGEEVSRDVVLVVGERVLVCNQRPASSRGKGIGTVTTMRDRTELVSMQSQLSSNLSLTDTLRAQTHEFANQLHTISGLVQLEEYDEVVAMVGQMTRQRRELADYVAERILDLPLAALVVAKSSVASEAGVELILSPASTVERLPADVSADLVTIVGNLVDNAVEACRGAARPTVELVISAGSSAERSLTVEVRDNGEGVPEDARDSIFVRGFSTKEEVLGGRGIGLALVRLICSQRGGSVRTARDGETTLFRVELPFSPASPSASVS